MKTIGQIMEILLLGLIGGAVPGPMLAAVFTEVLSGGLKKSFKVILRALAAEAFVAMMILLIVFALDIPRVYFYIISLAGSIFLIWLAANIWKINKVDNQNGEIFSIYKIFILTVLSGAFWIFWLTVCVPRAFSLKEQLYGGQFIFLMAFESGWLIMTALLAFIFSRFRPLLLRRNLVSIAFKFFALLLVFFAVKSIFESVIYFLNHYH